MSPVSGIERWERAVEKVYGRLQRVAAVLDAHGIPYHVVGGMAVAEWGGTIDPEQVRSTRDVDIAIRREDAPLVRDALERAGYRYKETLGLRMLLEPGAARAGEAVLVLFAGEKVRERDLHPIPSLPAVLSRPSGTFAVVPLESLVRMKLTSFRLKDKVHLLDLLGVGLITPEVEATLPADLMARLQDLKDNPEG